MRAELRNSSTDSPRWRLPLQSSGRSTPHPRNTLPQRLLAIYWLKCSLPWLLLGSVWHPFTCRRLKRYLEEGNATPQIMHSVKAVRSPTRKQRLMSSWRSLIRGVGTKLLVGVEKASKSTNLPKNSEGFVPGVLRLLKKPFCARAKEKKKIASPWWSRCGVKFLAAQSCAVCSLILSTQGASRALRWLSLQLIHDCIHFTFEPANRGQKGRSYRRKVHFNSLFDC